ncbi:MAG: aldehyde dehydrogenase family protein [Actinomycetota bacterium]|nr:aldehyde dehydrogenase family protein [Acidimicrobiia bacterium]MDQ3292854.1 aldehyde dehydrogenase family protein [Actinomycetota bacterium]
MSATVDDIERAAKVAERLWNTYRSGSTRNLAFRQSQLEGVRRFLQEREADIVAALRADLGKPTFEAYASDVGAILSETALLMKHLPKLAKPRRIRTPLLSQPAKTRLVPEPWGAVLLFPAWNYPVALSLLPLVGALSAGNTVALKPSELAPASSSLLAEHLPCYLDGDAVAVVEGGPEVAEALLAHRFAHIHYTGSARVGRLVMRAASDHLTPVTLELGGKNPAYVHGDTDPDITGRRIFWGRLFNAGQTCMSPDYVLVRRSAEAPLIDAMARWATKAYGPDPRRSPDLGRMVSDRHFDRVVGLLDGAGEVAYGGDHDRASRYVGPTILRDVPPDHPILHEEIFGPVLPVVAVDGPGEAITEITSRPDPLTMYVFTGDRAVADEVIDRTTAGSVVVNQMFTQGFNPSVPFGGVGESGMGAYTGLHSFECFSHLKPVVRSPLKPDIPVLYPPYKGWKSAIVRRILK